MRTRGSLIVAALGLALHGLGPSQAKAQALIADLSVRVAGYAQLWEEMEIRKAAAELRAIWVLGNEYLQAQQPWAVFKTNPARAGAIVRCALNLVALYGVLARPFIPDASAAIAAAMGADRTEWPDNVARAMTALAPGHAFTVPANLFAKITDDDREEMAARFAGS